MRLLPTLLLLTITAWPALAQDGEPVSGLKAAKQLPKLQAKGFAGLTARGGQPAPERWLVLVHDEKAAGGVREFSVADGAVAESKEGSDFAASLASENRIDPAKVRVDSDLAAELAASYASVNNLAPATYDYDLRRAGTEAAPLWTINVFEESGARLGRLVIAGDTGAVVSHEGFAEVPTPADLTAELPAVASTGTPAKSSAKKTSSSSSSSRRERESASNPWRKVGGKLQRFFTGRDTISR